MLGDLLKQVTVALAVGEAAYEFEHRDLHWFSNSTIFWCTFFSNLLLLHNSDLGYRGNILLSRKDSATLEFNLEGKSLHVRTFGLWISIIDFTLSRINTGESLFYLGHYTFSGKI